MVQGEHYSFVCNLVEKGTTTTEIVERLLVLGVSRSTTIRYIKRARGMAPPPKRPFLEKPPIRGELDRLPPETSEAIAVAIEDRPDSKILSAARDMETVRKTAMTQGQLYDPRVAIGAAQAEAQILIAASKLSRELREASSDDITMHPQFAKFRAELVRLAAGTELEAAIITLTDVFMGPVNGNA